MIQRPSLVQFCLLGDLYNAHKDNLLGISILKSPSDLSALTVSNEDFVQDKSYLVEGSSCVQKLCHNFVLSPQHQLNVLCGLCPLEGSARYLLDDRVDTRSVRVTLRHSVTTNVNRLNISSPDFTQKILNLTNLQDTPATHVVIQANWGNIWNVVTESRNLENRKRKEIVQSLLDYLRDLTLPTLTESMKEKLNKNKDDLTLTLYGDSEIMENIPWELTRHKLTLDPDSVDWKGHATMLSLMPLEQLGQLLNVRFGPPESLVYKPQKELEFLPLFDQILEAKQKLNCLIRQFEVNDKYSLSQLFPPAPLKRLREMKVNLEMQVNELKCGLEHSLPIVRMGPKYWTGSLTTLLETVNSSPHSARKILDALDFSNQVPKEALSPLNQPMKLQHEDSGGWDETDKEKIKLSQMKENQDIESQTDSPNSLVKAMYASDDDDDFIDTTFDDFPELESIN